jgi:hypothetical protein
VTLPTPVLVAGGTVCLLVGYLIGGVVSPDAPDRTTAVVSKFDEQNSTLCLKGDAVSNQAHLAKDGTLCGFWNHSANAVLPNLGDKFRFVSIDSPAGSSSPAQVLLYGAVDK